MVTLGLWAEECECLQKLDKHRAGPAAAQCTRSAAPAGAQQEPCSLQRIRRAEQPWAHCLIRHAARAQRAATGRPGARRWAARGQSPQRWNAGAHPLPASQVHQVLSEILRHYQHTLKPAKLLLRGAISLLSPLCIPDSCASADLEWHCWLRWHCGRCQHSGRVMT